MIYFMVDENTICGNSFHSSNPFFFTQLTNDCLLIDFFIMTQSKKKTYMRTTAGRFKGDRLRG